MFLTSEVPLYRRHTTVQFEEFSDAFAGVFLIFRLKVFDGTPTFIAAPLVYRGTSLMRNGPTPVGLPWGPRQSPTVGS